MKKRSDKRIVALSGGLGNQMFQYAFGRMLQERYGCELEFDDSSYTYCSERELCLTSDRYNIGDYKICSHPYYNLLRKATQRIPVIRWLARTYKEYDEFCVDDRTFDPRYRYYAGYWQDVEYYSDIREKLKNELRYIGPISSQEEELLNSIRSNRSIAVHVRRGDYLDPKYSGIYVLLDESYYRNAIASLKKSIAEDATVFFVSNDIEWCKKTFSDVNNSVFVDESIGSSAFIDFEIIRNAMGVVMSNSTFSWWAAWLSGRSDQSVIVPAHWFFDPLRNDKVVKALTSSGWDVQL